MLILQATIMSVSDPKMNTNRNTGEITHDCTVSAFHTVRGNGELENFKIDISVSEHWKKAVGREFRAEVRPFAMTKKEGGLNQGLSLIDKKSLPTLVQSQPTAQQKAA
jgi:hypothetical protein